MIFYPVFIRPARGYVYRRRHDGVIARVDQYRVTTSRVRLVDKAGKYYIETPGSFWDRWVHADLYDTERN